MRERAISSLLTAYYGAPKRIEYLKRRLGELGKRVSLLEAEMGESALKRIAGTLPGTVSSYEGPAGHSNAVSNPTLMVFLRLKVTQREIKGELAELYADVQRKERELNRLERIRTGLDDIITGFEPCDRTLLKMRYQDGLTFDTIAERECGGATAKTASKRIHKLEQEITESYIGHAHSRGAEGGRKAPRKCPVGVP